LIPSSSGDPTWLKSRKNTPTAQSFAINRISASTWKASFRMAKLIYTSVVRPTITYGAAVWYAPQGIVTSRKHVDRKLEVLQNKNLRNVLGAYRAVGSRILEKEAGIPPISTVLTAQVANATKRRLTGKGASIIKKACATIRNQAIRGGSRRKTSEALKRTPGELMTTWLRKNLPQDTWKSEILQQVTAHDERPTPWRKAIRDHI
jgi:hypothetical protein